MVKPATGLITLPLLIAVVCACGREQPAPARVEAAADTAAGEVPFRLVGPNEAALVVSVHVDGEGPFDFVFDTGATLTCVDAGLAERLGLEEVPAAAVGAGAGGAGSVRLVRIDSLRLGQTRAHDLVGCVLDLEQVLRQIRGPEIHGLLGLNFIKSFRVTLDFEREVIGLEPL